MNFTKFLTNLFFFTFPLFWFELFSFSFVSISDLHVGRSNEYLNARKLEVRNMLLEYLEKNECQFLLIVGDLTDHGYKSDDSDLFENEWKKFAFEWALPISKTLGSLDKLKLCLGNHDTGIFCGTKIFQQDSLYDMFNKIKSIFYYYTSNKVMFICCGVYPDESIRVQLGKRLSEVDKGVPIVIFFHYTISRPCHGFDDDEKEEFYKIIKNHNIIGIINGHKHGSFFEKWHGIPVAGVGGYSYTICSIFNNQMMTKTIYAEKKKFRSLSV